MKYFNISLLYLKYFLCRIKQITIFGLSTVPTSTEQLNKGINYNHKRYYS